jgi:hypothetical protein
LLRYEVAFCMIELQKFFPVFVRAMTKAIEEADLDRLSRVTSTCMLP